MERQTDVPKTQPHLTKDDIKMTDASAETGAEQCRQCSLGNPSHDVAKDEASKCSHA